MNTQNTWQAPACISAINSGVSSWHVQHASDCTACRKAGVTSGYNAGHFALTGEGDPLHGLVLVGRTPGRALRRFRRFLQSNPVSFSAEGGR